MAPRILYVSNFHPATRAKDLAYEFERYGRLIRCDVPAPRGLGRGNPYAFVEFRSSRDAADAYREMHNRNFDGYRLKVEWAKNPPSASWRTEDRRRRRERSRSPRRGGSKRSRSPRRSRSRSREASAKKDGENDKPQVQAATVPAEVDDGMNGVAPAAATEDATTEGTAATA